jgi:TRAP-type transport system periplasmic protein
LTKALIGYFWGSSADKLNVKTYRELYDKFSELRKEFERVKLLGCTAGSPWRLMTIKPVGTLADLKGMKIKTTSDSIAPLKEFGAEGLEIPMKEAYERMKSGTLDGVLPL